MRKKPGIRVSDWPMRRKLFGYMLLLAALLLLALVSALFLFGRFDSTKANVTEALQLQMDFFEKDVATHFDFLAGSSISLSEGCAAFLDAYLEENGLALPALNNHSEAIAALEGSMIQPLRQRLLQEDSTGVFVMLDVTVNSAVAGSDRSRACVYLQQSGYHSSDGSIVLYRGLVDAGKAHGVLPHRKWRLELRTDLFPDYDRIKAMAARSPEKSYYLTPPVSLPETADRVMLMTAPIVGADGAYYGICGYEVSASYFMTCHAQPAALPHLTFLMSAGDPQSLDPASGFSCGVYQDYYRPPVGLLSIGGGDPVLRRFDGEELSYVGVTREVSLTPNNGPYALSVLMLKSDYDRALWGNALQNVILVVLLLFFAVSCCFFFSRQYLRPIITGLEQIKSARHAERRSSVPEINDLFQFLAEQDRLHEQSLHELRMEKQSVQSQYARAQEVYEQAQREYVRAQEELSSAQTEVNRLAYARKREVDPGDYAHFLTGIQELTRTERTIFEWYLEGKTAKDILELLGIKEGTLKFHNHNILGKLGVSSRKQMLRYAALMTQQEERGAR